MEPYKLQKTVWEDSDFEIMGWHDTTLWSMVADLEKFEFLFDLDYIFKWVCPNSGETHYKFWVSPVTMVFKNAHSIKIGIESSQGNIEVADLRREKPTLTPNGKYTEHEYRFDCQEGQIYLWSTGFKMYVRHPPVLIDSQRLDLSQRGGVSFDCFFSEGNQ
jgi:hypothetical protein